MANQWYGKGVEKIGAGTVVFTSANIKVLLVTNGYSPSINSDEFISDIGGGNIVARSGNLSTKTNTLGTFDADDITITSVTGSQVVYLIVAKDSGTDSSSPLLLKIDTGSGLPVTPNGGDIAITWDSGSNKIATL